MWIGLGIFVWLIGFLKVGYFDEKGYLMKRTFLRPPFLIYLICGLPKARNIPSGVMAILALIAQLQGILLIVYGIIYWYWPNHNFTLHGIILFAGTILINIFAWKLYKRYPYKVQ